MDAVNISNLNLKNSLYSGQVFRWNKVGDVWEGVVKDSFIQLIINNNQLNIKILSGSLDVEYVKNYLAIDEPYSEIISNIKQDKYVRSGLNIYDGYRILRQDPYETLISFIVSTNSNVAKIRGSLEKLAQIFGEEVFPGKYSLPLPASLAKLKESDVRKAGVGYRARYLINTARYINEHGLNSLLDSNDLEDEEANIMLQNFCGVGPKVADCILLFAFNRLNRVPLDVWVQRILREFYGYEGKFNYEKMQAFAQEKLGHYAGYASQFIYEAVRTGKIKMKD